MVEPRIAATDWHSLAYDQLDEYFKKTVDGMLDKIIRTRFSPEGIEAFKSTLSQAAAYRTQLFEMIGSLP